VVSHVPNTVARIIVSVEVKSPAGITNVEQWTHETLNGLQTFAINAVRDLTTISHDVDARIEELGEIPD
jgi:hypothetical protein